MTFVNDIKKTIRYAKKNGVHAAYLAASERLYERRKKYAYEEPSPDEQKKQREYVFNDHITISIAVPAYETDELFLQDLILSVAEQTSCADELLIADASESDRVKKTAGEFSKEYDFIRYIKLPGNKGIAENTNEALKYSSSMYTALLDHDDILTKDALYNVRKAIEDNDILPYLVYTDEDKCDQFAFNYFEPNIKKGPDPDMLFTNNYICHLAVYRTDVIKELGLRHEFDGAQDYDLALRCFEKAMNDGKLEKLILHAPGVAYHWRSNASSTSEDPYNKLYAYEAGKNAAAEALKRYLTNINKEETEIPVEHSEHLGFYKADYGEDLFSKRPDVGAVFGPVFDKGKICGGAMKADGSIIYEGLKEGYCGPRNVAAVLQRTEAGDIRNMLLSPSSGLEKPETKDLSEDEIMKMSLELSGKLTEKGYVLLYDPGQRKEA